MNYYIQGDAANADQIKAAFEAKGFIPRIAPMYYGSESVLFFTGTDNYIYETPSPWVMDIIKTHPDYQELELPVNPKFKVGDSLQSGSHFTKILSINLEEGRYYCDNRIISFKNQDLWHLVPKPHYDISNFKPYQKVLIRFGNNDTWRADFFSHIKEDRGRYFVGIGYANKQCIPFEGNEHLLGTTDMCDEQYVNW